MPIRQRTSKIKTTEESYYDVIPYKSEMTKEHFGLWGIVIWMKTCTSMKVFVL